MRLYKMYLCNFGHYKFLNYVELHLKFQPQWQELPHVKEVAHNWPQNSSVVVVAIVFVVDAVVVDVVVVVVVGMVVVVVVMGVVVIVVFVLGVVVELVEVEDVSDVSDVVGMHCELCLP